MFGKSKIMLESQRKWSRSKKVFLQSYFCAMEGAGLRARIAIPGRFLCDINFKLFKTLSFRRPCSRLWYCLWEKTKVKLFILLVLAASQVIFLAASQVLPLYFPPHTFFFILLILTACQFLPYFPPYTFFFTSTALWQIGKDDDHLAGLQPADSTTRYTLSQGPVEQKWELNVNFQGSVAHWLWLIWCGGQAGWERWAQKLLWGVRNGMGWDERHFLSKIRPLVPFILSQKRKKH